MITDVYMVSFADLKRSVGSKDHQLLQAILQECGNMLRSADGALDKDADVSCADALTDLIDGIDFHKHPPHYLFRYRCALEAIWNYLGKYLGQLEVDDVEELDKPLAELGIPLTYGNLVSGEETAQTTCEASPGSPCSRSRHDKANIRCQSCLSLIAGPPYPLSRSIAPPCQANLLEPVFEQFVKKSPISVMARATIENALGASALDELYDDTAKGGLIRGVGRRCFLG